MDGRLWFLTCSATLGFAVGCGHSSGNSQSSDDSGGGGITSLAAAAGGTNDDDPHGGKASGGVGGSAGSSDAGGGGSAAGSANAGAGGVATGAPGPHFIGRFTSDRQFAWSGSAIELRFTGDEVSVTLDDWGHNYFEIILDGKHSVLAVGADVQTYQLGSNLGPGEHEVLVYRRTEGFFGPSQFLGFSVPESAWLPSHAPAERKVEIVADSTAVGYGVEGADHTCGFSAQTENNYLAYGEITARSLGAEVRTLGWSGIGVYRDNSGNPENNMGMRYGRALPTEEDSTWDFSQWIPQAVVVNLGSNDFVADDPGPVFEDAFNDLLDDIVTHYPDAKVYVAVGSSLFDSEYPRLKPRLQAIVDDRNAAGDDMQLMDFGTTDYNATYGCDFHPSTQTHQLMADILTQQLKQDFGW